VTSPSPAHHHRNTVVRLRRRHVRSGAVALGEKTRLGAVWGGEHDGVHGFVGGATGGENPLTGVSPLLLSLSDPGTHPVRDCERARETEHGPRTVEWAARSR
jgi:hypothetical protein